MNTSGIVFDENALFDLLSERADSTPTLRTAALDYLLRNNGDREYSYDYEWNGERVVGSVKPGQLLVVEPTGKYHCVKPGNHDLDGAVLFDLAYVKAVTAQRNAAYTSLYDMVDALDSLLASQNGVSVDTDMRNFDPIGWCESTNPVRAFQLPEDIGEFEVDKTASWGQMQSGNRNHCVVRSPIGAYITHTENLRTDWFVEEDNANGDALIKRLPRLTFADLAPAIR